MTNQRSLSFVVAIATTLVLGTLATRNATTRLADKSASPHGDSLNSLGDITTKLVTTLVQADGEQVDIYGMANLVTALSKAATIVDHPDMYKDMGTGDLEEELTKLTRTVKVITQKQKMLQDIVKVQQERLLLADHIANQLNHSKALVGMLEEQLVKQDSNTGSDFFVGFTAWSNSNDYYSSGSTVKFSQVLFNYGAAYDPSTSKFTCPVSGVYSVNAHMEERNSGGLSIMAMLNSDSIFWLHIHDDSVEHGTSAASAMVGCNQGQQIYILTDNSGTAADVQSIEKRTVFSVFLIQKMSNEDVRSGNLMES